MGQRLQNLRTSPLARIIGMFVATVLTHGLTFALWNRQGDLQMILLTGALLLAVLILSPYRHWPTYSLGWWTAMMMFMVVRGYSLPGMGLAYVLSLLLLYGAVLSFGCLRSDRPIDDFPKLLWFLLIVAVGLPLTVTGMATGLTAFLSTAPWLHKPWWHMALSMSLGNLLLTPALLSLANPASSLRRHALPPRAVLLVTVLSLALLWLGWREWGRVETLRALLVIAPAPLLIYVALHAQIPGVSALNMGLGAIAIQLNSSGHGPFAQSDPRSATLTVQLWMLGMSVVSLFFAALVEQRRASRNALLSSNKEVRHLAGRLILAQEQERARIARDLHDDVNQRLALASMRLSSLRPKVDERYRNDVMQLQSELIALSGDIRSLSHGLHPSTLAHTGLPLALSELCHAHTHHNGPTIELNILCELDALPDDMALCIYRVVQEAMGNALKHAHATHIDIALEIRGEQVELTVVDDGNGFDTQATGQHGLGLMSIGERTKLLAGSYQLRSAPGDGTELCVHLPLSTPPE